MDCYINDELISIYCSHCGELLRVETPDGKCVEECCECEQIGEDWYCSDDAEDVHWHKWMDETVASVKSLADELGWEFDDCRFSGGGNTRSRYYTLRKECDSCVHELDTECECRELKLRVSDHGSCYCTEDVSLAMDPSGDDHTLENLRARLSR